MMLSFCLGGEEIICDFSASEVEHKAEDNVYDRNKKST